jgi:hypothetical protein
VRTLVCFVVSYRSSLVSSCVAKLSVTGSIVAPIARCRTAAPTQVNGITRKWRLFVRDGSEMALPVHQDGPAPQRPVSQSIMQEEPRGSTATECTHSRPQVRDRCDWSYTQCATSSWSGERARPGHEPWCCGPQPFQLPTLYRPVVTIYTTWFSQ